MFVRGGFVNPGDDVAGDNGSYWSSVGRNSSDAYDLGFNSDYVYPLDYFDRYFGFSVRCVALGD